MSQKVQQYEPRPGSTGGKALAQLRAKGDMAESVLAAAIEAPLDEIHALLQYPIRMGVLERYKKDGVPWWRVGNGVPVPDATTKPPAVTREPQQQVAKEAEQQVLGMAAGGAMPVEAPRPEPSAKPTTFAVHQTVSAAAGDLVAEVVKRVREGSSATAEQLETKGSALPLGFTCAIFNDGRLFMRTAGGQALELRAEETRELVRYLDRVLLDEVTS